MDTLLVSSNKKISTKGKNTVWIIYK